MKGPLSSMREDYMCVASQGRDPHPTPKLMFQSTVSIEYFLLSHSVRRELVIGDSLFLGVSLSTGRIFIIITAWSRQPAEMVFQGLVVGNKGNKAGVLSRYCRREGEVLGE